MANITIQNRGPQCVKIVRNELSSKQIPGHTSNETIQDGEPQCVGSVRNSLSPKPTPKATSNVTIQDGGLQCVKSVRNNLSPKPTTKGISNIIIHREPSQCEAQEDIFSIIKHKPSNQNQLYSGNILQCDGGDTASESSSDNDSTKSIDDDESSEFESEDEVDAEPEPIVLVPAPNQPPAGQPLLLEVDPSGRAALPSSLPLGMVANARSLYNKIDNFIRFLREIGPDYFLVSETWEHVGRRKSLSQMLSHTSYKVLSYRRPRLEDGRPHPGGGCAIIYNETRFKVEHMEFELEAGVETIFAIFTPKTPDFTNQYIKRICVGSVYIPPRSQFKSETIDTIIQAIHFVRSQYDNQVNFTIAGDFNRTDYTDILDSYGALHQCVTVGTRQASTDGAALTVILSDLHTHYHPPTTLSPLEADEDKGGVNGDHDMVVFAPKANPDFEIKREKKTIQTRPIPDSKIPAFGRDFQSLPWTEVLGEPNVNTKTQNFHRIITSLRDHHFKQKTVTMTNLDKRWMTPDLKNLHRRLKREFFRHRKSPKWKRLKLEFKRKKRHKIKLFHNNFVTELKATNPRQFYQMCKKVGAVDQMNSDDLEVRSLAGLSNQECAEAVGHHFAALSAEHSPVDLLQLPAYLPALPPPQVEQWQVYGKLRKLKNTRSTLEMDIENKLRNEVAVEITTPLTNIINTCLKQQIWPDIWKLERITPTPKVLPLLEIKDLRKIAGTSDYNKVLESFMKDFIMEDIGNKIDLSQYGGKKGVGTEHMIVALVDRVLALLDTHPDKSAVILSGVDWASAFARGDPTKTVTKFISLGLRPSLVALLISYFSDRKMKVKFNQAESKILKLVGGFPEGSIIGQDAYIVASNNSADVTRPEDRFKYIDDLEMTELICLAGLLQDYDVLSHVPSDIAVDQKFLCPHDTQSQRYLDSVQSWTEQNLMKINSAKTNYIIFSRCQENFTTRLSINGDTIDRRYVIKLLGVWISQDAGDWSVNTQEICRKAYGRISMLSKLKYSGVSVEDLTDIYRLFIRSRAEYCSVAFASSLTLQQVNKITNIEKTSLRIILQEMYVGYLPACEMVGIVPISDRRQPRMLDFAKKCAKHETNSRFFPKNEYFKVEPTIRQREPYKVNFAMTETYKYSTIPTCQRLLNAHYIEHPELLGGAPGPVGGGGGGRKEPGEGEGVGGAGEGAEAGEGAG